VEELLPKDNENIPLFDIGPAATSESRAFTPDQMVNCEKCQRANPPTRVDCLYCGAPMAFSQKTASVQRPTLRPLEKWEQGYSNVYLPGSRIDLDNKTLGEASSILKLTDEQFKKILDSSTALPLARVSTLDEALLIERRMNEFGLRTIVVADADLMTEASPVARLRAAEFDEEGIVGYLTGGSDSIFVPWAALTLLVQGRLVVKSLEVTERKMGKGESQILDSIQTSTDEAVVDIFSNNIESILRIAANSFDFSCLEDRKGLLAEENFARLLQLIREHTPNAVFDDSYRTVKQALEPVWSSEGQTESRGWKRGRPGKITFEAVTEISNESQFTRYARLRHYLSLNHVTK
jgi:hypothetical protein